MDKDNYDGLGRINQKLFLFRRILINYGVDVTFDNNFTVEVTKRLHYLLKDYDEIPNIQLKLKKDNEKAMDYRTAAVRQLQAGNTIVNVLYSLNQCVCWADGEELVLGYAHRSYVYLACRRYDICLQNIDLAIKVGCTETMVERLTEKLITQRNLCIDFLYNSNENIPPVRADERFVKNELHDLEMKRHASKLALNSVSNLTFAVEYLDLQNSPLTGRYYTAQRDLNPGQILSIEEPFANVLTKPFRYQKCANCFKENYMNLIPCTTCPYTMYCSEKCLNDAQIFHKFECPILEFIWEECEEFALTLRLVLKTFTVFDTVDELIRFHYRKPEHIQLKNYVNEKQRYSHVSQLVTNQEKRNDFDMFIRCCKVALLYHFLIERTEFSRIFRTQTHRDTLISLILQYSQIASINSIPACETDSLDLQHFLDQEVQHVFAVGLYPFASLFNHSCIPNTSTVYFEGKLLTYVTRPIKKNVEVFTSYHRVFHTSDEKENRQKFLNVFFQFTCNCEACYKNYPTYELVLRQEYPKTPQLEWSINTVDVNNDVDNLEKLCSFLKRYDSEYPCPYLSRLWLRLKRAMTCKYGELSTNILLLLGDPKEKVVDDIMLLFLPHRRP